MLQLVFQPLQELSELYGQVQAASAAMTKISTVLDAEHDITDKREGAPRSAGSRATSSSTTSSSPTATSRSSTGSRSTCPQGGCIALVGESGGGKSTTAKLIARFYDPLEGAVRIDGTDLRDVQLRSVRRQLGVVLQDPFLFSGTIADNIRFARPEATDEEVAAAAHAIGVDRITARFDGGLDHVVREGGAGLSAGERQLISIARALLADPRILILDEATSNIDRPSEILIEQAFDTLLARPDVGDHRPPARDGATRGRDPRDREGAHHPARHRGGAARRGRAVPATRADAPRRVDARRRVGAAHQPGVAASSQRRAGVRSCSPVGSGEANVCSAAATRPSRSRASDPRGRCRRRRLRR